MPEKYNNGFLWNPEDIGLPEFYQPSEEELAAQQLAALVHDTYQQRESKKRQRQDARRELFNTPVQTPATFGSATAPAYNVEIPRVESTVGKELGTAAAYAAAPAVFSPGFLNFAGNMAVGLPAFEVADRIPTLWGHDRATVQGGNLLESGFRAAVPEGKLWQNFEDTVAPYVNQAGQLIAGLPVGAEAEILTRGAAQGIMNKMARNAARKAVGNFDYMAPVAEMKQERPIGEAPLAGGYSIERYPGYQLKMLMAGNPLEKQLSKTGTISVNSIRAQAGKASKVEKAVIEKVLNDEAFKGQKSIDYNKFRKAVQDELITYERVPNKEYAEYGMDRIGQKPQLSQWSSDWATANNFIVAHPELDYAVDDAGNIFAAREVPGLGKIYDEPVPWEEISQRYPGWKQKYAMRSATPETFTFESPRIPNGSGKHYGPNTLGHSRTYTTADEPDVLHVMESQSDWAQEGRVAKRAAYVKDRMTKHPGTESDPDSWLSYAKDKVKTREKEVESFKKMLETGTSENGEKLEPHAIKQIKDELLPASERRLAEAKSRFYGPTPQEFYLADNYTTRQIQENLRYAAEKGQKKMRYPTRETAAKIEGYQPAKDTGKETEVFDWLKKNNRESSPYSSEIYEKVQKLQTAIDADLATPEDIKRAKAEIKKLEALEARWLKGEITYSADLETILSKYEGFPKEYQKLYKGADLRTVTDPKGNTWYEVDVPENYLQQEWAFKYGGLIDRLKAHYGDNDKIREAIEYARGGQMNVFEDGGDEEIPIKYDVPLKRSEIPTKNKTVVIDNFSPNYDYIVEGDKVYYSRKGKDYWVDISDNDTARKNLLNFIGDRYNFRGYEDDERAIRGRVNAGDFDYKAYRDSLNNLSSLKVPTVDYTSAPALEENKYMINMPTLPNINYVGSGQVDNSIMLPEIVVEADGKQTTTPAPRVGPDPITALALTIPGKIKNYIENSPDAQGMMKTYMEEGVPGVLKTVKNGLSRRFDKVFLRNEEVPEFNYHEPEDIESAYGIIPGSFTGDTLRYRQGVLPREYFIPESIDVSEHKFGVRNRGDLSELETEGAVVTTFHPFSDYSKEKVSDDKSYVGIDANGRLKVGSGSEFGEGDKIARTFANKVYSFAKDASGNYKYQSDAKHGNANQNVALVNVEDEKTGKIRESSALNVLVNKKDAEGNTYGSITGGRVLVKVGNETRLLSGSIQQIEAEFEAMKKRQHADYGYFYTLDNGSYNKALRTYDKKLTKADLANYDKKNVSGGNFIYLQGNAPAKFPQDTLLSPNVRTTESESYKKGHPIENANKGVVLHYTAFSDGNDMTGVTNHFLNPNTEASAHLLITPNGNRRIFATPDQVAFHAGYSTWNGVDDVNDFMHGIEFQAPGPNVPLTKEQVESAVEYLKDYIRKYNIPLENITSHEIVRRNWLDTHTAAEARKNKVTTKMDLSPAQMRQVIDALKKEVYYKKADGGFIHEFKPGGSVRRKYDRDSKTDDGDLYYDIVRQRRNSIFNALLRSGMEYRDAARLTPMITTQQTMEGGWKLNRKDNNFGGMRVKGKTIVYGSEDDFQDAYLKMLDSKWHTGRPEEYSWHSAKDLDDWARILNREDLGLHTEEDWKLYNKGKQGNDFVYLYAPEWENNNKPYREHLRKTEDMTKMYLKMLDRDEPLRRLVPKTVKLPKVKVRPESGIIQNQQVAPIVKGDGGLLLTDYASGGNLFQPGGSIRRQYNGENITEEKYKELQRQAIIDAAVYKALTRGEGVAPILSNGELGESCIYTATDNFGKQYRVAGNQSFSANPSKYGFEVAGILDENPEDNIGRMYQFIYADKIPKHMGLITGVKDGKPLISYSHGEAQWLPAHMDYQKNEDVWMSPWYETYRFVGTPEDNARWSEEFNALPAMDLIPRLSFDNLVGNIEYKSGGRIHIKPENRGKFTALKKRTGHSASWFKAHGTPAQKKMAVFALNAKKWKHGDGGIIDRYGADAVRAALQKLK